VLVLSGYGLRVAVERGLLAISDGIGRDRREGRLARATCGLKRLVVLGHSGTVSLEALRWLYDVGAAFVQIDADGEVLVAAAPPGLDDARLRRAQASPSPATCCATRSRGRQRCWRACRMPTRRPRP
jgi:hypothetical protein